MEVPLVWHEYVVGVKTDVKYSYGLRGGKSHLGKILLKHILFQCVRFVSRDLLKGPLLDMPIISHFIEIQIFAFLGDALFNVLNSLQESLLKMN